jgi:hypothetical protein
MNRALLTVVVALAAMATTLLTACDDMNNYSVSPNHRLAFSADTVSFDTVFTSIGSVTGYFMVYNPNDEALQIEHITLASGGQSGFRINVDGRKGDSFQNVPIWKNDSLYVAVEVTVDPNDEYQPFVIYDSVVFVTNGVAQSVTLEAYGHNAHIFRGGVVFTSDTTLLSDRPYLVFDSVKVAQNVTLTIEKGAVFYMHKDAQWRIDGTLQTLGAVDDYVVFRGDRLNNFSTTISYDNIAAQWRGFFFSANSFNNVLNYTMIRNGTTGLTCEESSPEQIKLDIRNSQINNMDGELLIAINCHIEASNSEFSNASGRLALLAGGFYRFAHCSLVNYMPAVMISAGAARTERCLTLSDNLTYVLHDGSEERRDYPLRQAYFDNCIIDGSMSVDAVNEKNNIGELFFVTADSLVFGHDKLFNYRFNHCFIKSLPLEGERFIKCLYTESPAYVKSKPVNKDDKYDYIYDFRPADKSSVIGAADPEVTEEFPTDRFGVNRLNNEYGASIGAYEYVKQDEDEK